MSRTRTMDKTYSEATYSLMGIADRLEQIEISFCEKDAELADSIAEIWDDIYDLIIYKTIPRSLETDFNTLMEKIHGSER